MQPEVLRDIARLPGFRGRGLLARILYALPVNTVGHRRIGPPPVPRAVDEAYAAHLHTLVCTLADWTDPAVLPLIADADTAVLALEAELEPDLAPHAGYGHIADWASKWVGACLRIAGLLHLAGRLRDGWGHPIEGATVEAALHLSRYYLAHALAVFDAMAADPVAADARHLLDHLTRTGASRFTRRELFSAVSRGRYRKVSDLDPALHLLAQHGWIRPVDPPARTGPGRPPSPAYLAHPQLAALSAQSAEPAQPGARR